MSHNVSHWDRILRGVAALAMLTCAVLAPLPLVTRVVAFGAGGVYLLGTALVGSCLGYKLMGMSTCRVGEKRATP